MSHAVTLDRALRLLARARRVLDYQADEIQSGRALNRAHAGIAQDLAGEIVALVGHSVTDQPEAPEMFALREYLDELAEGGAAEHDTERRRWLNWLATTGYGQDFTHDDEPPCTPRELAEVLNERQPLDQDVTPGYTTGVDLWLWTLAECTGYGRCGNCGGDPATCDCDES